MADSEMADKIFSLAPQWTFEGDCMLLEWMQQIANQMEQSASRTSEQLNALDFNLRTAGIALDNASNSLSMLQHTQFVESRVHDDDETNAAAELIAVNETASKSQPKSATEELKIFLQNNMQMLHNCYQKLAIDLDDSDEEEEQAITNCIYQPKNPYNERSLPHIYGTKQWKEDWSSGICDEDNNYYSADEKVEEFSDSSQSGDDIASLHKNSDTLSQSSSQTTLPPMQNASSLHGSQQIPTATIAAPVLTKSIATAIQIPAKQTRHDLFANIPDTPPSPTYSTNSSTTYQRYNNEPMEQQQQSSSSSFGSNAMTPKLLAPSVSQNAEQISAVKPIKRKPVNLFDDDDFDSLMHAIVEKAQKKPEAPVPATRNILSTDSITVPAESRRKSINLFDETDRSVQKQSTNLFDDDNISATIQAKSPKQQIKLFDDDDDDDDFLSILGKTQRKAPLHNSAKASLFNNADSNDDKVLASTKTATTKSTEKLLAKNLFDDDVDEFDENNLFGESSKKKQTTAAKQAPATQGLFDDVAAVQNADIFATAAVKTKPSAPQTIKTINLFDDNDNEDDDIFAASKTKLSQKLDTKEVIATKLFDDVADDTADIFGFNKTMHSKAFEKAAGDGIANMTLPKPVTKSAGNVFDDAVETQDDATKNKDTTNVKNAENISSKSVNIEAEHTSDVSQTDKMNRKKMTTTNSLFADELEDDDDDIFGTSKIKSAANVENSSRKMLDQLENQLIFDATKNKTTNVVVNAKTAEKESAEIKAKLEFDVSKNNVDKSSSNNAHTVVAKTLFEDDLEDDDDDIFGTSKNKAIANVENITKNMQEHEKLLSKNSLFDSELTFDVSKNKTSNVNFADELKFDVTPNQTSDKEINSKESITKHANIVAAATLFDDELQDDDDIFGTTKNAAKQTAESVNKNIKEIDKIEILHEDVSKQKSEITSNVSTQKEAETNNLFENEISYDLKYQVMQEKSVENAATDKEDTVKIKNILKETKKLSVLFDEDQDEANDDTMFGITTVNKVAINDNIKHNTSTQYNAVNTSDVSPQNQQETSNESAANLKVDDVNAVQTLQHDVKSSNIVKADSDVSQEHLIQSELHTQQEEQNINETAEIASTEKQFTQNDENNLTSTSDSIWSNSSEIKSTTTTTTTTSSANSSSNKNSSFAGIFLDEPPDDDDFFEALHSSALPTGNKYSLDLENDFLEPALPELPPNNAAAATTNASQFYNDLQLFSDVPPEDTEANNTNKQKTSSNHAIFSNEPPDDMIEHDLYNSQTITNMKVKEIATEIKANNENATSSQPLKINKLKQSGLNINVQALLPGASNNKLQHKKQTDETNKAATIALDSKNQLTPATSKDNSSTEDDSRESLLNSYCKNRARGPANRKPSTKRGRIESYRKSLQADQIVQQQGKLEQSIPTAKIDNEKHESPSKTSATVDVAAATASSTVAASSNKMKPNNKQTEIAQQQKTNIPSKLFVEDSDSEDDLFKSIKTNKTNAKAANIPQNTSSQTIKSVTTTTATLFESDNDENDDFLSSIKTTEKTKKLPTLRAASATNSLFSDDASDDEDLFGTKTSKASTNQSTKRNTNVPVTVPSTTKSPRLPKTTTIADDPLSDLLNPSK